MAAIPQSSSSLSQQAKDAEKKVEAGAHDASKQAQSAGAKAQDNLAAGASKAEHKADKLASDAQKKTETSQKKAGGSKANQADKDKLKVAGAAVAVAAALVFGGIKVHRNHQKNEPKKGKAEDKAGGLFNFLNRKSEQADRKLDGKGTETKNKAADITDNVVSTVKGAAEDVGHTVSSATKDSRKQLSDAGIKVEEKGLKASQDSDRAVRDAYYKAADRANRVGESGKSKRAKDKAGNIFDNIGDWFNDRKDEASNAAGSAKKQVQDAGKKGKK